MSGKTCTAQTCDCVNHDAVLSLFLCTKLYCNGREIEEGVNGLNETCRTSANVSLPSLSEVDHYLDEKEKAALRHFERSDAKEFDAVFPIVNNVVVVGESLYRLAYDTLVSVPLKRMKQYLRINSCRMLHILKLEHIGFTGKF